ncbi:MAG TPA: potassium uptake protein, TrkH family [Candidatus Avoscillospira avicola]|uniref:Potassium uptake protein, TrkH family n=1 Tax=Candidatus Avoscillospira avicola TaxID=2840706 RepID=A0A9D1DHH8_9FIRM|nr:potassium uptake protein, TrkH family [Candidatus Avoscillospira avicola]
MYKLAVRLRRLFSRISPMQMIVLTFMAIILLGGLLLSLPISSRSGQWTSYLSSVFTATSATCVTGLTLFDTYTYWTGFGQAVILILIQVGGLGFMTIASLFFLLANRRIGLRQRVLMAQSLGIDQLSGIVKLVHHVLVRTAIVEGMGALILTIRFSLLVPFDRALWWGVFHSVSAFCNAGFDVVGAVDVGGSLIPFVGDWVVNFTIIALITVGGLGFFVWEDVLSKRSFRKTTVYTKMVLIISAILALGGGAVIALLEWNNPATLGNLPAAEKCLAALFQSVTSRTAGFYSIPQGTLRDATKTITDVLMFIGGSSGSTAGGVKTATMGVLVLAVIAAARGRSRVTVFRRTISAQQVSDAVAVTSMVFGLALSASLVLSATNGLPMIDCLFETISAIATVGLSTGITPLLNEISQILLIILMYFGRVGVMTVSLGFLFSNAAEERYKYADTKVMIG